MKYFACTVKLLVTAEDQADAIDGVSALLTDSGGEFVRDWGYLGSDKPTPRVVMDGDNSAAHCYPVAYVMPESYDEGDFLYADLEAK